MAGAVAAADFPGQLVLRRIERAHLAAEIGKQALQNFLHGLRRAA